MFFKITCPYCQSPLKVSDPAFGKTVPCPGCNQPVAVPQPTRGRLIPRSPALLRNEQLAQADSGYPACTGVGQLVLADFIAWAILLLITFVLAMVLPALRILVFAIFGFSSIVIVVLTVQLLMAKRDVLTRKEIDLFFGLAKLVGWDPTEAVLILKNKLVSYVDDNLCDGGGIKVIYPIFGEELACRAPLEIQTLDFSDERVLTREYLPLLVQGTMKWRIVNLQRFYLLVSKEIHAATDERSRGLPSSAAHTVNTSQPVLLPPSSDPQAPLQHISGSAIASRKFEAVEQWLRYIAEEQTRAIVSRVSIGLLLAERVAADLSPEIREEIKGNIFNPVPLIPSSTATYRSATDGLAAAIRETVTPQLKEFGIDVYDVTLQEVGVPQHIREAAVKAYEAAYRPFSAQADAIGRKLQLQAEADVIGAETVGAREVVKSAPAYALGDFLSTFLVNNRAMFEAAAKQRGAAAINAKGNA